MLSRADEAELEERNRKLLAGEVGI